MDKSKLSIGYFQLKDYALLLAVTLVGLYFGVFPPGFLGAFTLCVLFGLLAVKIGDTLPIVNKYLGGGSIVALFGAAVVMYYGWLPEKSSKLIVDFVKSMDFLGLVVAALVCGSILSMDRKLLIRAGALYAFPILAGIACAFALAGVAGVVTGYGWKQAIMFVALPIMGGGTAAGAVPTAAAYSSVMAQDNTYYLSLMMPAVVLGNALAVIFAGLLHGLGTKFPSVTGNGVMMKNDASFGTPEEKRERAPLTCESIVRGFVVSGVFFIVGRLLAKFIPGNIHYYAWTIIACAGCKISGLFPESLVDDVESAYMLISKAVIPGVLFSIGFVYTDLKVVLANMNVTFLILVSLTVLGAIIGPWIVGSWLGFNKVEVAMTAGLCMANMGGSGDVATLGAGHRMMLMPFAQISSRIGGAIVVLIASILARTLGQGM